MKECEDQIALLTTRNEELARELEEAKFDLDKAQRQVNKLDYKLYTLAKVSIGNNFVPFFCKYILFVVFGSTSSETV